MHSERKIIVNHCMFSKSHKDILYTLMCIVFGKVTSMLSMHITKDPRIALSSAKCHLPMQLYVQVKMKGQHEDIDSQKNAALAGHQKTKVAC